MKRIWQAVLRWMAWLLEQISLKLQSWADHIDNTLSQTEGESEQAIDPAGAPAEASSLSDSLPQSFGVNPQTIASRPRQAPAHWVSDARRIQKSAGETHPLGMMESAATEQSMPQTTEDQDQRSQNESPTVIQPATSASRKAISVVEELTQVPVAPQPSSLPQMNEPCAQFQVLPREAENKRGHNSNPVKPGSEETPPVTLHPAKPIRLHRSSREREMEFRQRLAFQLEPGTATERVVPELPTAVHSDHEFTSRAQPAPASAHVDASSSAPLASLVHMNLPEQPSDVAWQPENRPVVLGNNSKSEKTDSFRDSKPVWPELPTPENVAFERILQKIQSSASDSPWPELPEQHWGTLADNNEQVQIRMRKRETDRIRRLEQEQRGR